MPITKVTIDGSHIKSWKAFHDVFRRAFGFPGFYGNNMNAWIDCMTSLDAPSHGLTGVHVASGEVLTLEILNATQLRTEYREYYDAIIECSAFVNYRRLEQGEPPVLALSFWD